MQLPSGWPRPLPSLPGAGEKAEDLRVIRATAGRLWLAGVPVDDSLEAAPPRRVPLPGYPYERVRCWIDPDDSVEPASAPAARVDDTRPRPVSHWFAVPVWRQAPPVPSAVPAGRFVVFAAERRGDELAAALREAGKTVVIVRPGPQFAVEGDCWQIRPAERGDYDALIEGLANEQGLPDRFVHAWALAGDPAGHDVAAARAAQEHGFFSLLRLGQAIAAGPTAAPAAAPASAPASAPAAPTRLDVLVAGTQDVRGDDLDRPEHATTAGITRVLPLEIPGLTARRIDLDPGGTPVGRLLAELASEPAAETVALRGGRRWVREFADLTLPEPAETEETSPPALREGGRYLITGGLGGLGLTLAADLARRSRTRLVLLSRTGKASHPDQQAAIAEMERAGSEVQVIAADVSDPESMARVRDQVIDSLGGLDGIVHAAGVPGGGLAEVKDEAAARAVLEPKLAGSLVLLSTLGEITRDFIALCSSVTAVTGGVGQVDYCGANAFLDALAGSGHGLPGKVISLNWGGWSEVGMLAKALEPDAPHPLLPPDAPRQLKIDHPLLRTAAIVEPAGPVRA